MDTENSKHRIQLISEVQPTASARAWCTAPHPTLPIIATCASDKTVRIYSLTSFTQLSSLTGGHKRSVRSCAWKPNLKDESVLATGSFDSSAGLWRRDETHHENQELDFTRERGNNDEEDEDEEWRIVLILDGHDSEIKGVAWSAGGNFLATCSRDKSIWIWEEVGEEDFETIAVLQEHSADVKCVAWHPEEEMVASGSYDNDIRLWKEDSDDWTCMGVLSGHTSTVWSIAWESVNINPGLRSTAGMSNDTWIQRRKTSGPRLASCSDDLSIRIWRRTPKERREQNTMSIIRSASIEEEWVEEARLPQQHDRTIYSISWSSRTGRIVSTGSDGRVVVYEERWAEDISMTNGIDGEPKNETTSNPAAKEPIQGTSWHVMGQIEEAHGPFEVNHVAWAKRADRGKQSEDEEIIVTTGDDGAVKIWSI